MVKEYLAFLLAKKYRVEATKYRIFIYRDDNVKKTKWWKYFLETAEKYYLDEDFDYEFFIKICFQTYGKIYPSFLQGKQAEKVYRENFFKESTDSEKYIKELELSASSIQRWSNMNKKEMNEFFNVHYSALQNKINYVSPFYLPISKSFLSVYSKLTEEQKNELVSKNKLSYRRAILKSDDKLFQKAKEILKDDFI